MDILSPISHVLWLHVQGLTSLWPNQYTEILLIQELCDQIWWELQNYQAILKIEYVTRWRTTGHEYVTKHATYSMHACAARSNMPEIQSTHRDAVHLSLRAPNLWDQIWWELQNYKAILGIEYVVRRKTTCHGWVAKHSIYFMSA